MLRKIWYRLKSKIVVVFLKVFSSRKYKLGRNIKFRRGFLLSVEKSDSGKKGFITIGNNVFFNNDVSLVSRGKITIGDDCNIAENVKIYDHNHRFRNADEPVANQGFSTGEIHIGKNCWIGSNAVILKGACIGNHCVIGAGAVIDFNVPDNSIVKVNSRDYEIISMVK